MVVQLQPVKRLDDREQATYFHSRERRRSLAGVPELFQTHRFVDPEGPGGIGVASIDTGAQFPVATRARPVTFRARVRFNDDPSPRSGLLFELGDAARAVALWFDDTGLGFRAGGVGSGGVLGTHDNGGRWSDDRLLDITASVKPAVGRVQVWIDGRQVIRAQNAASAFDGDRTWASGGAGSFGAAAQGGTAVDVAEPGPPVGFQPVSALAVYTNQFPRHFLSAAGEPAP